MLRFVLGLILLFLSGAVGEGMASLPALKFANIRHSRKDFQQSIFLFFLDVWRRHDFAVPENGRAFLSRLRFRLSDKKYIVGSSLLCDLDWRLGLNRGRRTGNSSSGASKRISTHQPGRFINRQERGCICAVASPGIYVERFMKRSVRNKCQSGRCWRTRSLETALTRVISFNMDDVDNGSSL